MNEAKGAEGRQLQADRNEAGVQLEARQCGGGLKEKLNERADVDEGAMQNQHGLSLRMRVGRGWIRGGAGRLAAGRGERSGVERSSS